MDSVGCVAGIYMLLGLFCLLFPNTTLSVQKELGIIEP